MKVPFVNWEIVGSVDSFRSVVDTQKTLLIVCHDLLLASKWNLQIGYDHFQPHRGNIYVHFLLRIKHFILISLEC
jgi:hypothetical protein